MRRETANIESVSGAPSVRDLRLERPEVTTRTAVVVMGMHRSGTSVLTRIMSFLGCDLPQTLIPPGRNNEAGYWESRKLTDLNDEILASAGTSWDDWTAFNPGWLRSPRAGSYKALLQQTLEQEFGDSPIFVVKDPRICRFPALWLDALADFGASPKVFHQIRSPVQVGQSLFRRSGIPHEVGHLLWLRHVLDAEFGTRGVPRAFSSYHRLLERGSGFVEEAASPLDIHWPRLGRRAAEEIDEFIDADLRHHADPESVIRDASLSPWLRDAFAILTRWADEGERDGDRGILDDIRNGLDAATNGFYGVVDAARRASRSVATEKAERERLEATLESERRDAQEALGAALEAAANEQEAALAEARAAAESRIGQLGSELEAAEAGLREAQAALAAKSESLRELEAAEADLRESQAALAAKSESLRELEAEHEREMSARARAEVALKNSETERARMLGELAAAQERGRASAAAAEQLANRFAEERTSLQGRIEELRSARASLQDKCNSLQEKLQTVRAKRNALRDDRDALKDERNALKEERDALRGELRTLGDELRALEAERNALRAELERSGARQSAIEERLGASEAQAQSLGTAMAKLQEDESRARRTVEALSRRLKSETRLSVATRKSAAREMGRALLASRHSRLPLLGRFALKRQAARLRTSGVLDPEWYIRANPDVAKAGIDPAVHYLVHGWKEGRQPNGTFAELEGRCRGKAGAADLPSDESTAPGPTDASG